MSIKWTKSNLMGEEAIVDGFKVSRVRLSGWSDRKFHYYVHWIQYPEYSAPHRKMSLNMRSIAECRKVMKQLRGEPSCLNIMRYNEFKRLMQKLHSGWIAKQFSDEQYEFNRNIIRRTYGIQVSNEETIVSKVG